MGLPRRPVEPFPHQLPMGIQHHGAHHGVGTGGPPSQGGERQSPLHPDFIHRAHQSFGMGRGFHRVWAAQMAQTAMGRR